MQVRTGVWGFVLLLATGAQTAGAGYELQLEMQLAGYRYQEPGLMQLQGTQPALAGRFAYRGGDEVFVALDGRLARSRLDYDSLDTGNSRGEPNEISDWRLLAGRRFDLGGYALQPYAGLGQRRLVNDARGLLTSSGDAGYRRTSTYRYLPVGIDLAKSGTWGIWSVSMEYDHLIRGLQQTDLSRETVFNPQERGYGLRASLMLERNGWSVGPYWQFWKIGESAEVSCSRGLSWCSEPANRTRELGIVLRTRFLP